MVLDHVHGAVACCGVGLSGSRRSWGAHQARRDERATLTLRIFDRDGRLVRSLLKGEILSGARHSVRWNGRKSQGQVVKAGRYEFRIKAVDAAGNKSAVVKGSVSVR